MLEARRLVYLIALVTLFILLAGNYTLSFFGVSLGSIRLFGVNLEHEYAGIGLVTAVIFAGGGIDKRLLLVIGAVGLFLLASDVMAMRELLNPLGVLLSVGVGFAIGWLTIRIAHPLPREE